ncbi:MAG: hypothetical protein ACJAVM_003034 [Sulfitobacter sp.]|jgi:hypothetical protein
MTTTFKTLAIAGLMGALTGPAFAAGHMSTSMTCAEWKALGDEDQMKVVQMALAEIETGDDGESMNDDATATETGEGVSAEAATDADDGSATGAEATANESTLDSDDPMMTDSAMAEFERVCNGNLDAMVSEAAIGMEGTR